MRPLRPGPKPLRLAAGLSRVGGLVTLVLLVLLALGSYSGWSYYRLLDRVHSLSSALDKIHRHRGTTRVTAQELIGKTVAAIRARGGRVSGSDVTVTMVPLTLEEASALPAMWRTRLNMACFHRRIQDVQDRRIDNRVARIRGQPQKIRKVPSTAPPPLEAGARVSCWRERLARLGYTFVRAQARVLVKVGWFHRYLRLDQRFYLEQHPAEAGEGAREAKDGDDHGDGDDDGDGDGDGDDGDSE